MIPSVCASELNRGGQDKELYAVNKGNDVTTGREAENMRPTHAKVPDRKKGRHTESLLPRPRWNTPIDVGIAVEHRYQLHNIRLHRQGVISLNRLRKYLLHSGR